MNTEHVYFVSETGVLAHNVYQISADEALENGLSIVESSRQGRQFRTDWLEMWEFDENLPGHVRGWLRQERRLVDQGRRTTPRTPPGYEQGHGLSTPAREGFDYSNSHIQNPDLNDLEETVRHALGLE